MRDWDRILGCSHLLPHLPPGVVGMERLYRFGSRAWRWLLCESGNASHCFDTSGSAVCAATPGNRARLKVGLACLVFFLVAAPYVALLSKKVGHLSTGEVGKLAYAGYVDGLPRFPSWNPLVGSDSPYGTPEHKIRTLLYAPVILDFATPVKGTNPLSYDVSYWYAGARVHFDLREQWTTLKTNYHFYLGAFLRMVPIFSGAVVLCILGLVRRPDSSSVWLILWPVAACGMYALVHVEERFLPGFLVLFWLALYALLWQRVHQAIRNAVLWTVLFTLLVPTAVHIIHIVKASAQNVSDKPDYVLVGEALRTAGIHQGDVLATAGGFDYPVGERNLRINSAYTAYYAHYIGARVVAAIVDPDDGKDVPQRPPAKIWYLNAEDLTRVKKVLTGVGVKAIVALDKPADSTSPDWKQVTGTRYSILPLNGSDLGN